MGECVYIPSVFNKKGQTVPSKLFMDLQSLFKDNRDLQKKYYEIAIKPEFIQNNKESLQFDENGEVTIKSLIKVANINVKNEQVLQHLNKQIDSGNYSYSEAINKVTAFNRFNEFSGDYIAILTPSGAGKYKVQVQRRTPDTEQALKDVVKEMSIRDTIMYRLRQMGVSVEFLDKDSQEASSYNTVNPRKSVDGYEALIKIAEGKDITSELAEEAGHFIFGAMGNNELVQRMTKLLTPELQEYILNERKITDKNLGESARREIAGYLIGRAIVEQDYTKYENTPLRAVQRFLQRILNWCKRVIYPYIKHSGDSMKRELYKAQLEAELIAEKAAANFMLENSAVSIGMSLEEALKTKEILYSSQDSKQVAAYKNVIIQLKRIIEGIQNTGDKSLEKTVKNILGNATEGTLQAALRRSPLADLLTVNSMCEMLKSFHEDEQNLVISKLLEEIDLNNFNKLTPQQIEHYGKNLQKIRAYVTGVQKIIEILNVAVPNMDNINKAQVTELISKLNDINSRLLGSLINKEKGFFLKFCEQIFGRSYIYKAGGILFTKTSNLDAEEKEIAQRTLIGRKRWGLGVHKGERVSLERLADVLECDMGIIRAYFTSASNNSDVICQIMDKAVKYYKMQADRKTLQVFNDIRLYEQEFQKLGYSDTSIFYEKYTSNYNEQWYDDLMELREKAWEDFTWNNKQGNKTDEEYYNEFEQFLENQEKEFHEKRSKLVGDQWVYDYTKDTDKNGKQRTYQHNYTGNLIQNLKYGEWEADLKRFTQEARFEFKRRNRSLLRSATDIEVAIAWDKYYKDKVRQFHRRHSKFDRQNRRWMPREDLYENEDYKNLSQDAKNFFENRIMPLKEKLDKLLPERSTELWRAPQFKTNLIDNITKRENMSGLQKLGTSLSDWLKDKFCKSVEDPEEFGCDLNDNSEKDQLFESSLSVERQKLGRIPLYGINKLKDKSQLSTNLFYSLMTYANMAYNYNSLDSVVGAMEAGQQQLLRRKFKSKRGWIAEGEIAVERDHSRVYNRFTTFLDKEVYGISQDKDLLGSVVLQKMASNLNQLASFAYLGGNITGGIVNAGTGFFQCLVEACAGQDLTLKDFLYAHGQYIKNMGQVVSSGAFRQHDDSDVGAFIRYFNVRESNKLEYTTHDKESQVFLKLVEDSLLFPYKIGDHLMQSMGYLAIGHKIKVYQITEQGTDSKGNPIYEKKSIPLTEAYEYATLNEKDGKTIKYMKRKDNIYNNVDGLKHTKILNSILAKVDDSSSVRLAFNEPLTEEEISLLKNLSPKVLDMDLKDGFIQELNILIEKQKFNDEDELQFMMRAREVCNRMYGIYNNSDKVGLQNMWYWNLCTAMKGYALGMVNRRFSGNEYIASLGRSQEGSMVTFLKLILTTLFNFNKNLFNSDFERSAYIENNTVTNTYRVPDKFDEDGKPISYKEVAVSSNPLIFENKKYKSNSFLRFIYGSIGLSIGRFIPSIPAGGKSFSAQKAIYRKLLGAGFSASQVKNLQRNSNDYLLMAALTILQNIAFALATETDDDDDYEVEYEEAEDGTMREKVKQKAKKYNGNLVAGLSYYMLKRWNWESSVFNNPYLMYSEANNLLTMVPPGASLLWDMAYISVQGVRALATDENEREGSSAFYQRERPGIEEFDSKAYHRFMKLLPVYKNYYLLLDPIEAAKSWEYSQMIKGR